jgi:hypothetical protein
MRPHQLGGLVESLYILSFSAATEKPGRMTGRFPHMSFLSFLGILIKAVKP